MDPHFRMLRKLLNEFEGAEIIDLDAYRERKLIKEQEEELARWNDRPQNECSIQEFGDLHRVPGGRVVKRRDTKHGPAERAVASDRTKKLARKRKRPTEGQDELL